jgi:hypothetical protein
VKNEQWPGYIAVIVTGKENGETQPITVEIEGGKRMEE